MEHECASSRPNSLGLRDAMMESCRLMAERVTARDPAPWFVVTRELIDAFSNGDEAAFVRRTKIQELAWRLLLRALLDGRLSAHFSDGRESIEVPAWVWADSGWNTAQHISLSGSIPLNVFLPDSWQRWAFKPAYLDRDQLMEWLNNPALAASEAASELPLPHDRGTRAKLVQFRQPPNRPFVTLSEAISWIAFGNSVDCKRLTQAIDRHEFGGPRDAQDRLERAVEQLTQLAAKAGNIVVRGKFKARYLDDDCTTLTEQIVPVRFHDFACFMVFEDTLQFGSGLSWTKHDSFSHILGSRRDDAIVSVTVDRSDLLRHFPLQSRASGLPQPSQDDTARALFVPLPASIPGIGPVMAVDEALSWLAYGKPSNDIEIWQNAAGDLILREPSGKIIQPSPDGSLPRSLEAFRQASRTIHDALRDGTLPSYVAPITGTPLTVPRFYWNRVNPESLHHVYRGMTPADNGTDCPVLLSRKSFDEWRTKVMARPAASAEERSTAKGERDCKEWLLAAFATDTERKRSKTSFQDEALKLFAGRLSVRGFLRVWDSVASQSGRSTPGRKS